MQKLNRRTFLLLGGGATVAAAVGTGGLLVREHRRRQRNRRAEQLPVLQTQSLAQLGENESFDVCIVGSGMAAAVLGSALARAGFGTVMLESGYHPKLPQQARIGGLETAELSSSLDYPLLTTRLRALGGTTNVWTGNCYRFHPGDFDANPYAEAIGPWPIRYADIESYYVRAESTLRVRGGLTAPYSPRRSNELPPYLRTPEFPELEHLFERAGLALEAYPLSQAARDDRDPVRSLKSVLPGFVSLAPARLVSGATVTRLQVSDNGEVTGAEARDPDGVQRVVKAGRYVIAAGAIESARLLLLSSSERFPQGLGNSHDQVGRRFMEHIARHLTVRIPGRKVEAGQRARCYQFHEEFLRREFGGFGFTVQQRKDTPDRLDYFYDAMLVPAGSNRVTLSSSKRDAYGIPAPQLSFSLSERDEQAYAAARAQLLKVSRSLGAIEPRDVPGYRWAHHHMSTCRMGKDPATSVVNADLRVHDSPNTYVLGSGVFASSGAGHPTLLIVALAHRLADHMVARLQARRPS